MYRDFLSVVAGILLASSVHGQDRWGLVRISRSRESLADCLGDQDFLNNVATSPHSKELKLLVRVATENFHSKTSTREEFADFLSKFWLNWPDLNTTTREKLDERFVRALIDCSDDAGTRTGASTSADPSTNQALPVFVDRPPRTRVNLLLDYLLVDWRNQDVFGTAESRAVARRFAEDVFDIFADFDPLGIRELDFDLRFRWDRRAQLFYDDRSPEHPYVGHDYSLDKPTPYTRDDPGWFVGRRNVAYRIRSQPTSPWKLERLQLIYRKDPVNVDDNPMQDFVRAYESRGMTSADDYFQSRRILNYRILLVLLDLAAAGALGEGKSDYEVPDHLRALLWNDDAYGDYLDRQRRRVLDATADDEDRDVAKFRKFLGKASRVREVCLIALLLRKLSTDDDVKTTENRSHLDDAMDTGIFSTTPKSPDDGGPQRDSTAFRKRLVKCSRRLNFDCRQRYCGGKPGTSEQCPVATLRRKSNKTCFHLDETVRSMKILASSLQIGFATSFLRE